MPRRKEEMHTCKQLPMYSTKKSILEENKPDAQAQQAAHASLLGKLEVDESAQYRISLLTLIMIELWSYQL